MEANEAMKAMARRVAADEQGIVMLRKSYLDGARDDTTQVRIALAAIMETTELAAKYAEHRVGVGLTNLAADYRTGEHYALAGDRHG